MQDLVKNLIARLAIPAAMLAAGAAYGGNTGESHPHRPPSHYTVINFPSLGGTNSGGIGVNNRGLVTGFSYLAGDRTVHAAAWLYGMKFDLGTLGGANSAVLWPVKNNRGIIVGVSQTSTVDPLGEAWSCSNFIPASDHTCVGFVWQWGTMRPLPTLGGNNGFATGVNDRGEIVGWAENDIHDPTCNPPQVLQFEAVVWGPGEDRMRQLQPYGKDPDSAATAINNTGQVVGISGKCANAVGGASAIHAVLWEHGRVIKLGNLGGDAWNTPMAINDHGEVVGFSNIAGNENAGPNFHAFVWSERGARCDRSHRHGRMCDLDALKNGAQPDDTLSEALGINARGTIVGVSYGAAHPNGHAVIWQDGKITDLNEFVAPGYSGELLYANDINDRGDITGAAYDPNSGETLTFFAMPTHDGYAVEMSGGGRN